MRDLRTDDCGVTVAFSDGDDWFDFVVEPSPDFDASLALVAAEMLGDALDIFPDTNEALRWWEENLQPFKGELVESGTAHVVTFSLVRDT